MFKTLHIDVPGIDARTAHRLVVATLTHYGFQGAQISTKQTRNGARLTALVRHCANDHEGAAGSVVGVLPAGSRVGIDHRNPFMC